MAIIVHIEDGFPQTRALRRYQVERAMLSTMLGDANVAEALIENLDEGNFTDERCRIIFRAIRDLALVGLDVDLILLTDELSRRDQLDDVGGNTFIGSLA